MMRESSSSCPHYSLMNLSAALTACGMLSSARLPLTFSIWITNRFLSCNGSFKICKPKSEFTFSKNMQDGTSLYMNLPRSSTCYAQESRLDKPSPIGLLVQSPSWKQKTPYVRSCIVMAIMCMTNLNRYRGAVTKISSWGQSTICVFRPGLSRCITLPNSCFTNMASFFNSLSWKSSEPQYDSLDISIRRDLLFSTFTASRP